jgi:hypothetical protein
MRREKIVELDRDGDALFRNWMYMWIGEYNRFGENEYGYLAEYRTNQNGHSVKWKRRYAQEKNRHR